MMLWQFFVERFCQLDGMQNFINKIEMTRKNIWLVSRGDGKSIFQQ